MNFIRIFIVSVLLSSTLFSNDKSGEEIAKRLGLRAGSKAILQWERVFKSSRKMKRYNIDKLSPEEKEKLKEYLIEHAIDSDHPTVAGV
jgi:hypothetical protein